MLPSSALLIFPPFFLLHLEFCFLSGCNKDVLFNLRLLNLTELGLYKLASDFKKL